MALKTLGKEYGSQKLRQKFVFRWFFISHFQKVSNKGTTVFLTDSGTENFLAYRGITIFVENQRDSNKKSF